MSEAGDAMQYFRLFPDVIHLPGASSKGVLYLLAEGRMVKLGATSNEVVSRAERNTSIPQIAQQMAIPEESVRKALALLEGTGAGCHVGSPAFVEKVRQPDLASDFMLYATPPVVERFGLVLTSRCSQRCGFCAPSGRSDRLKPCVGCRRDSSLEARSLTSAQVRKAIGEVASLDCLCLDVRVGDPVAFESLTLEAIEIGSDRGIPRFELFAGSPLPEALLHRIGTAPVVTTLQFFSGTERAHDLVFGEAGAFRRLVDNCRWLRERGRPFGVYYLDTGCDEDPAGTLRRLHALGPSGISCDRIIGRSPAWGGLPSGEESLWAPGVDAYVRSLKKDCVESALTLRPDGTYHFCAAAFDEGVGHVDTKSIQEIFRDRDRTREGSARLLEAASCQECEYRLACRVCKAGPVHATPDGSVCGYRPREGAWAPPRVSGPAYLGSHTGRPTAPAMTQTCRMSEPNSVGVSDW